MKTKLFTLAAMLFAVCLSGCKQETESNPFDYSQKLLCGTWEGSEIYINNQWVAIAAKPEFVYTLFFASDGTYSSSGYLGQATGTYKAMGTFLYIFIDNEERVRYNITCLGTDHGELTMYPQDGAPAVPLRIKRK